MLKTHHPRTCSLTFFKVLGKSSPSGRARKAASACQPATFGPRPFLPRRPTPWGGGGVPPPAKENLPPPASGATFIHSALQIGEAAFLIQLSRSPVPLSAMGHFGVRTCLEGRQETSNSDAQTGRTRRRAGTCASRRQKEGRRSWTGARSRFRRGRGSSFFCAAPRCASVAAAEHTRRRGLLAPSRCANHFARRSSEKSLIGARGDPQKEPGIRRARRGGEVGRRVSGEAASLRSLSVERRRRPRRRDPKQGGGGVSGRRRAQLAWLQAFLAQRRPRGKRFYDDVLSSP